MVKKNTKYLLINCYRYFSDDEYYEDITTYWCKMHAKLEKKLRSYKIYNFLLKEQIEDDEY